MTERPLDPDEAEIESSRMPLLDHLMELRDRVIRSVIAVAIAFGICFAFADQIYTVLLQPFEEAVRRIQGPGAESLQLIFTAPLEFFIAKMKLALFAALCLAFPYLAYELYGFIAPGLYKREKMAVLPYLIVAPLLFGAGIALVHFVVMPRIMEFSIGQEMQTAGASIELLPRVTDYLNLTTTLMFAFGIAFQLPLVLMVLAQAGVVGAKFLRGFRKFAIVALAVFAAIVTPPDPFSMLALLLPLWLLYEVSIVLVGFIEKRRAAREAAMDQTPREA